MTGIHVYVLRSDHEDRVIAALNAADAIEADYRRFVDEALQEAVQKGTPAGYATRPYYDAIFEQVVAVGELEVISESAVNRLRDLQGDTP